MKNDIYALVAELESFKPLPENETTIREQCHNALSLILPCERLESERNEMMMLYKRCCAVLNELEKNIIINSSVESFRPFYRYDIPLLVKNTVCAADILLHEQKKSLKFPSYEPFYCACNEKLITRAVCELISVFQSIDSLSDIIFRSTNNRTHFIISAETIKDKHSVVENNKSICILSKIAHIHDGSFVIKKTHSSLSCHLSVRINDRYCESYRRIPGCIDILSDRLSDVSIILNASL